MYRTLVRNGLVVVTTALALAVPAGMGAQEIPGGDNPFGVREPIWPLVSLDTATLKLFAEAKPTYILHFVPTATAADGLNAFGANLSITTDAVLPGRVMRFQGGYRRLDLTDSDPRNRWLAEIRLPLTPSRTSGGTNATVIGDYSHTSETGSKYKLSAAADQTFLNNRFSAGATGFYVANETVNDVGISASAGYVISPDATSIVAAYRFPNVVEAARDYSLTLTQRLSPASGSVKTNLILGAGRGRSVWASLSFTL